MAHRAPAALVAATLAVLATPLAAAPAKYVATLRVMLNPTVAASGTLPDGARDRLEKSAGTPLQLVATTRTGALEFALAGPRDHAALATVAKRLRLDRAVLWVDPQPMAMVSAKAAQEAPDANLPGRKFLVRLERAGTPDWPTLLPQLSARVGADLKVERAIGPVWVLSLPGPVSTSRLVEMAQALEQTSGVRYADPVRRLQTKAVPTDPYFANQWALTDPIGGIDIASAWTLGTGAVDITVAVIDTGILDHPDLAGRVLPGYDFITDPDSARDGDGRDPSPRDEGNWAANGDCGGEPGQNSFWHGLFVTGILAANPDNDIGLAGLNWAGKILPVRALGRCGGTYEDVFEAMLWAAGVNIDGVPANTTPAKVINMSLGGFGACGGALQEAVDLALAQGTVIVAAAGNEADYADNYAPANCGGVITVGASSRTGQRTGYSNFGRRVDLSAPGGDGDGADTLILSTFNTGTTTAGEPGYVYAAGTSFSTPLVSGVVSLMLSRNPNLTGGQVLSILQGTARDFPAGSACGFGAMCGAGLLDAGAALASTIPASTNLPDGAVAVVEYYDSVRDHYFITASAVEIADRDTNGPGQRTGYVFYAWPDPHLAPAEAVPHNVCRFYGYDQGLVDSHYFTADPGQCSYLVANGGGVWQLQDSAAFWIEAPDQNGTCREGTVPVYRFFNNRRDANQRHTIDLSVRRGMVNRAWVLDGPAANGAAFCSPI